MPHERFMGPLLLPNHVDSLRNYYAQISLIDAGVGRVVEALRATGELENTIIVYSADHGFSLGNHGIWGTDLRRGLPPYIERVPVFRSSSAGRQAMLRLWTVLQLSWI